MDIFAHNGVDHGSASEAVAHSLPDIILTVALVTLAIIALMSIASWAATRLLREPVRIKDEEEQ